MRVQFSVHITKKYVIESLSTFYGTSSKTEAYGPKQSYQHGKNDTAGTACDFNWNLLLSKL